MRFDPRPVAWLLLLLPGLACGSSGPSAGTRTNWLKSCTSADECDGLACLCGVCSKPCSTTTDCGELAGVCAEGVALDAQCGSAPASALCVMACATPSDCPSGFTCIDGACAAPRPLTCPPDALVCSDFERADLPGFSVTAPPSGRLQTTTEHHLSGAASLLVEAGAEGARTRLIATFPPLMSGTLHLRLWVTFDESTTLRYVDGPTIGDPDYFDWGVNLRFYQEGFAFGTPAHHEQSPTLVPLGRWLCVQETVTLSDTAGAVELRVDGVPVASATGLDTLPERGAQALSVGIDHRGQAEPITMYLDDLLLSTEPTPCIP